MLLQGKTVSSVSLEEERAAEAMEQTGTNYDPHPVPLPVPCVGRR